MSLSRKRTKELKRLRSNAEALWSQQQELLDRANEVAREAKRQVGYLTKEELAPRVRDGIEHGLEHYVRPSAAAAGSLASSARDRVVAGMIPAVGSAIGTTLSVVDHAKDARLRAFEGQAKRAVSKVSEKISGKPPVVVKSGPGMGAYVATGLGLAALAGIAYAIWQTFRADDELWVADDEVPAPVDTVTSTGTTTAVVGDTTITEQ